MRAIVLSGGGAKGAYQVGVWKALRKLHISYDIVTGTSVGALNGAMMVQKDYLKAIWLWQMMNYRVIFGPDFDINQFLSDDKIILSYAKEFLKTGGMEVSGLEETVTKCLSPRRFFRSPIRFGLVTVKFPSLKPCFLSKKDFSRTNLADYLVASASCFPAFKMKTIHGTTYMDGGFYDNLPINLAIDLGADEIIAVDLEAIGRKQKVKKTDIPITYIRPRNEIGSFLVFKKELTRRGLHFGYNDTMKTFGKLDGDVYTFHKDALHAHYQKLHHSFFSALKTLLKLDQNESFREKLMNLSLYKRLFTSEPEDVFLHTVERAGKIFEVNEEPIYRIFEYRSALKKQFYASWIDSFDSIEEELKKNKFQFLWNNQTLIHYLYYKMTEHENNEKVRLQPLVLLFPEEFLCALYVKLLLEE